MTCSDNVEKDIGQMRVKTSDDEYTRHRFFNASNATLCQIMDIYQYQQ